MANFFETRSIDPSSLADKVLLITGCNGFLGKRLLAALIDGFDQLSASGLSSSHHIYAIDNCITSSRTDLSYPEYVEFIYDNAVNYDYNRFKHVDLCIHLAGLASPAQYKKYPLETIDVAITLTRKLLELCQRNRSRFLFFSSSEIYGNPDPNHIPTTELYKGYVACQGPRACYDESKRMGETLCYVYSNYYNVHTNIIRPFNVYGPGMGKYDYRMIPNLMKSVVENKPIDIYGSGNQTRTFCYIDDAIAGIIQVLLSGQYGETYNIGNPCPEISMIDLIRLFNKVNSLDHPFNLIPYPVTYPADEPLRRCPDISKAVDHLNYNPTVSLEEGLVLSFNWAMDAYSAH